MTRLQEEDFQRFVSTLPKKFHKLTDNEAVFVDNPTVEILERIENYNNLLKAYSMGLDFRLTEFKQLERSFLLIERATKPSIVVNHPVQKGWLRQLLGL